MGKRPGLKKLVFRFSFTIVDCNDALHDFSVWLRTVSNPADIYRFKSHTGSVVFVHMIGRLKKKLQINYLKYLNYNFDIF